MKNKQNIGVVILAAGLGKRMNSAKLKVMHELNGRPLIDHVVRSVEVALPATKPVVVVCNDDPSVQNYLGDRAKYVVQAERLGTGHAVSVAESALLDTVDHVVVLYGDMPLVASGSIKALIERHVLRSNTVTLMTVTVPDFNNWRSAFFNFGRVVRGLDGHIARSVEKKDATVEELQIKELNPCIFCFKSEWLWKNLKTIKNNNAQQEYYLTDLVQEAIGQNEKISSISIEPHEAIGINTPEDLVQAGKLLSS